MRRGTPDSAFSRPQIAIANTASDLTPCNAHLIGGEAHTFGCVHGLEQIAYQSPDFVIDLAHFGTVLPEHRRTEKMKRKQAHAAGGVAGAELPTRMMRERSMTTVAVPLSTVTRTSFAPSPSVSLMSFTRPMIRRSS